MTGKADFVSALRQTVDKRKIPVKEAGEIKINVRLEYFQTERSRTVNIVAGTIRKD